MDITLNLGLTTVRNVTVNVKLVMMVFTVNLAIFLGSEPPSVHSLVPLISKLGQKMDNLKKLLKSL